MTGRARAAEREVRVFDDAAALSEAAAELVAACARGAVAERERFTLVLAGGSTPRALYELLAEEYRSRVPWERTAIFFGDERAVPPDDPESNYGMALGSLLRHVPVPATRVHRMRGELGARDAADDYEAVLRRALPVGTPGNAAATFDLALLGVGADGHTASLFPGSEALGQTERWAAAAVAPPTAAVRDRITLTMPALGRARVVCVLAAGAGKREIVAAILSGAPAAAALPAAVVRGAERTIWLVDRAARGG